MHLLLNLGAIFGGIILLFNTNLVDCQNIVEGRIVTSNSGASSSSENKECKPISECKSFLYLLQKHRTPDVLQDLVARDCGFSGTTQLIWCPVEEKLNPSLLVPDDETRGGGIITSLLKSKQLCNGSLTIMHYGDDESDFKRTKMTGGSYQNLKILQKRFVVKIEAEGNCCWKLHSEIGFRGNEQETEPGYSNSPQVQPKSIKRVLCSE